jgi:hypothetical protein
METSVHLDIARERRIQGLASRSNPIQYRTLETFCVIGACTGDSFLKLDEWKANVQVYKMTYQFSHDHDSLFRAIHEAVFKTRYHLQ